MLISFNLTQDLADLCQVCESGLLSLVPSTVPVEGQVWDDRPGRNIMQHRDGVDE